MTITVELITPERMAYSDVADFVVAPAFDGEIGVLPGHAPFLSRLNTGEVRLQKGSDTKFLAVSGGFIEVQHGNRVSIFAETAEFAHEIDVERAKQAAERAKEQLAKAQDLTAAELAQVEASLSRAIIRLKLGQLRWRKQPPTGIR